MKPLLPLEKSRQKFAERRCPEHGMVQAVKQVPVYYNYTARMGSLGLITNPLIYGARTLASIRNPYLCPQAKCGKRTAEG